MNEKYVQPAMPADCETGILKGMHLVRPAPAEGGRAGSARVQLLGSGTLLREALAAAEMLEQDFSVTADVWSVTSFTELARDGAATERWNRLHPEEEPRLSFVERQLARRQGPAVAVTDYVRAYGEQIRPLVRDSYRVLGTDGFGRSDGREQLRRFFEVDRSHVCVAALSALADDGEIERSRVAEAIRKYGIDPEKPAPATL